MLISDEYRELNKKLHQTRDDYGMSSGKWVDMIFTLIKKNDIHTILDYGCGKGLLKKGLEPKGFYIAEYDPAIEGKDSFPLPADMIVCTDVFEHIEEECIDEVLRHIQSLMRKAGFFTVSIVPAKKQLGDGRNAHILLRSSKWWLAKLMEYFDVVEWSAASSNEIIAFVHPISVNHE